MGQCGIHEVCNKRTKPSDIRRIKLPAASLSFIVSADRQEVLPDKASDPL
jgi:hypothetical protein